MITSEQRDWIFEYIDEYTVELGITNYPYVSACDLKDYLTDNTTEDDMRKHKWSEGETNQALTTEDEHCTECGGQLKPSLKSMTDSGIGSLVDTPGYRCTECKKWFREPLITEDECICIGDVCLCGKGSDFGGRVNLTANTTEDEEIKGAKIWEKKCFVSILYARGSITEEQREEIYKWLDAGYPDLDEQEVEIVMRQNQKYDPSSELPQSLGLENDYLENEPAEDEPKVNVEQDKDIDAEKENYLCVAGVVYHLLPEDELVQAIDIIKSIEYIDVSDYFERDTKWKHCPECGYKEPDGHWKTCRIGLFLDKLQQEDSE